MEDDDKPKRHAHHNASWEQLHSWAAEVADHIAYVGVFPRELNTYGTLAELKVETARLATQPPELHQKEREEAAEMLHAAAHDSGIELGQPSAFRRDQFTTAVQAWLDADKSTPRHDLRSPSPADWGAFGAQIRATLEAVGAANIIRETDGNHHLTHLHDMAAAADKRSLRDADEIVREQPIAAYRAFAAVNAQALGVALAPAKEAAPPLWRELRERAQRIMSAATLMTEMGKDEIDALSTLSVLHARADKAALELAVKPDERKAMARELDSIAKNLAIPPEIYRTEDINRNLRAAEVEIRAFDERHYARSKEEARDDRTDRQGREAKPQDVPTKENAQPAATQRRSSFAYDPLRDHHAALRDASPVRPQMASSHRVDISPTPDGGRAVFRDGHRQGDSARESAPEQRWSRDDGNVASPHVRSGREVSDRALTTNSFNSTSAKSAEVSDAKQLSKERGKDDPSHSPGRGRTR